MIMKSIPLCVALLALHAAAYAQTDCDLQKAARNSAMESTLGVSGNCDAKSAVKEHTSKQRDNNSTPAEREDKINQMTHKKQSIENASRDLQDALKG